MYTQTHTREKEMNVNQETSSVLDGIYEKRTS